MFGLILVRTFGREYSDHTTKDLLALPTPRTTIVAARFTVTGVWCLLLTAQTYLLSLAVGAGLGLRRLVNRSGRARLWVLPATALLAVALVAPFALVASITPPAATSPRAG